MAEQKGSNAFFWGFVLGAAAGAVATLLKTPRSGKETIGEIRRVPRATSSWVKDRAR